MHKALIPLLTILLVVCIYYLGQTNYRTYDVQHNTDQAYILINGERDMNQYLELMAKSEVMHDDGSIQKMINCPMTKLKQSGQNYVIAISKPHVKQLRIHKHSGKAQPITISFNLEQDILDIYQLNDAGKYKFNWR